MNITDITTKKSKNAALSRRLDDYQEILMDAGIDPAALHTDAALDRALEKIEREAEQMLAKLPKNHPLNLLNSALDGYAEHRDEQKAKKDIDVALRRGSFELKK